MGTGKALNPKSQKSNFEKNLIKMTLHNWFVSAGWAVEALTCAQRATEDASRPPTTQHCCHKPRKSTKNHEKSKKSSHYIYAVETEKFSAESIYEFALVSI